MATSFFGGAFFGGDFFSGGSTPPAVPGSGSSGGDSQWTPPGWLIDMLEDEERMAAEQKKLRRKIVQITQKKDRMQERIATPSLKIDYGAMIASVQSLAAQLQALMDSYREITLALEYLEDEREKDDVMEIIRTLH
jgi:hypothetical protein